MHIKSKSIYYKNKVSLQTNLERNLTNLSYIFILSVNFKNLTVRLHDLITSLILTKFQGNQRLIATSLNKCYNFKLLYLKLYIKNKLIDQIVNNIRFERNLICMLRI